MRIFTTFKKQMMLQSVVCVAIRSTFKSCNKSRFFIFKIVNIRVYRYIIYIYIYSVLGALGIDLSIKCFLLNASGFSKFEIPLPVLFVYSSCILATQKHSYLFYCSKFQFSSPQRVSRYVQIGILIFLSTYMCMFH